MKFIFTFLFCVSFTLLFGQYTLQPKQETVQHGIIYYKETTFNFTPYTNGLEMSIGFGKLKTYYLTKNYKIGIGYIKHFREKKRVFDYPNQTNGKVAKSFIYGKQNSFYVIRGTYGYKRYFSEKQVIKGVAVGFSYDVGFSLGILKPYYIEIFQLESEEPFLPVSIKYSDKNKDNFLNANLIFGASKWKKGLNELSVLPGLHGKIAAHFDWGAFDEYVKALETGFMLDIFLNKVPIMVETDELKNQFLFLNVFINLQIGKRK